MSSAKRPQDFESQWQDKLSRAVEARTGREVSGRVLEGGAGLSDGSSPRQRVVWTCQALTRLAENADLETRQEILSDCHCSYPVEDLQDIKAAYQESGEIETALALLQARFEHFLRETLELEEELVETIIQRGWGLAGHRQGNTIIATKIPKSGYLREYFNEEDPLQKRRYYCHCPRVRDEVGSQPGLPGEYCYCGAGFYKGIWEEILGQPVQVEVLESVLQGDQVCKIAIHLP